MSSAISFAVMRYSMVRLSPRSITPVHPRIGVMAYGSPGSGERTSSEPKYVRWRGGHFSVEILTNTAVFVSVLINASLFARARPVLLRASQLAELFLSFVESL